MSNYFRWFQSFFYYLLWLGLCFFLSVLKGDLFGRLRIFFILPVLVSEFGLICALSDVCLHTPAIPLPEATVNGYTSPVPTGAPLFFLPPFSAPRCPCSFGKAVYRNFFLLLWSVFFFWSLNSILPGGAPSWDFRVRRAPVFLSFPPNAPLRSLNYPPRSTFDTPASGLPLGPA